MKKPVLFALILLILCLADTHAVYANPIAPPSLTIIVPNAPADLEISLGDQTGRRTDKAIESQFLLYTSFIPNVSKYTGIPFSDYPIKVISSNLSFEIASPAMIAYNSVFKLDLNNRTLTPVNSSLRTAVSTFLRVILTLILEGIVFYLFGFRKKWPWILFILINLFTQVGLNIWLNSMLHPSGIGFPRGVLAHLVVGEFFVFILEIILFSILVKEYERPRRIYYVLSANTFSLIAGVLLIPMLPI